jgi:hypothetical protein
MEESRCSGVGTTTIALPMVREPVAVWFLDNLHLASVAWFDSVIRCTSRLGSGTPGNSFLTPTTRLQKQ